MKQNIFLSENDSKKIAIIGLGKVGQTVLRFLLKYNIKIIGYDDNINKIPCYYLSFLTSNRNFILIRNKREIKNYFQDIAFAIVSPGIKETNYVVRDLKKNNIPIVEELDFVNHFIKSPIIAITGTNGKSTTTVLLGKMLTTARNKCFWGGNLSPGLSFSHSLLHEPKQYYVIEVSSFQLERCEYFTPHIGILLNISYDHLDRHKTLAEYRDVKFKIFKNQTGNDFAIVNYDDNLIRDKVNKIRSNIYYFSTTKPVKGTFLKNNAIYFNDEKICNIDSITLKGKQFIVSVLAAICAAKIIGIENSAIIETLSTFTGLKHRLEFVTKFKNVIYINNSMCTNPAAGAETLNAFAQPVILIAGGKEKKLPLEIYINAIHKKTKHTILFGENRFKLYKTLKNSKYKNVHLASSLKNAIKKAMRLASPYDIVLFSPGFASFDMFSNFEERGECFKKLVFELTQHYHE
ncbi:MAG: UDP-N-acetylmuramoyl-L-alanine--D-glutamate ligase [candidate division WOR-3 bacterium]|nr:UDP-N-acetylmuramoyl-L-alanine--D-glutamate ligase [candidate division WOR-3 bacterium]MCX7757346.1 UDP-N-acetylmuramoyl-L-alanine--D-glutamate ligase [candidate division WOR-3 bacterium]MDW7988138.1 UDP-N-acetylmuramoyl-L-alanine--D-glutamate ligase [candidate division WOR-3 bacterium]